MSIFDNRDDRNQTRGIFARGGRQSYTGAGNAGGFVPEHFLLLEDQTARILLEAGGALVLEQ